MSTPNFPPRPAPIEIAIGVASPNAQGQVIISTVTAVMVAVARSA